jgi:hypothetical protein
MTEPRPDLVTALEMGLESLLGYTRTGSQIVQSGRSGKKQSTGERMNANEARSKGTDPL